MTFRFHHFENVSCLKSSCHLVRFLSSLKKSCPRKGCRGDFIADINAFANAIGVFAKNTFGRPRKGLMFKQFGSNAETIGIPEQYASRAAVVTGLE